MMALGVNVVRDGEDDKTAIHRVSTTPAIISPTFFARKWYSGLLTWKFGALISGLCLAVVIASAIYFLWRNHHDIGIPSEFTTGVTTELRFVSREEWRAQPPTEPLMKLNTPVPYVIISHTMTDFCHAQSDCTFRVRFAQTFHIESRNWSDIAHNFLIGGDGCAYVGRGWDSVGAHSYGYNAKSIGISFIGTFNSVSPPKRQVIAAQQLIQYGIDGGKISPDFKLLGHRQISQTRSPGDALYSIITKWANWSPTP